MATDIFNKLAATTWDAIGNAFFHKISYGEDAITSINLLTLKNESFPNIAIEDTRASESTKGCDFEFWIGNDYSGWYRYAIQAKKIAVSSEIYMSLNHKVGSLKIPQTNILENYAKVNRAVPLYCLFNFSQISRSPVKTCNISTSCQKYSSIKDFGCSVTPLSTTRRSLQTRGARTFDWFHARCETLPWSCLVRCSHIGQHLAKKFYGMSHEEVVHPALPQILKRLISKQSDISSFHNAEIFSRQVEFRPRWIGVVQTETD